MSDSLESLADFARERAEALGFSLVGITGSAPSSHIPFLQRWLADGRHGEMGYLARPDAVVRRGGVRESMPEARAVIVVGHEYGTGGRQDDRAEVGIIARYARGRDYHKMVKRGLQALLGELDTEARRRGHEAGVTGRVYVDTGPILERELAQRAGLGWFGRNTMLIHPRRGSYFMLGALLVDLELDIDAPFAADHCGSCRACLDACPTGALLGRDADGAPVMDATRCISYLTIELRGPIPVELRPAMGNRVFGCDICQEVCPWNVRFGRESAARGYAARGPGELPGGVEALPTEGTRTDAHPGTASPPLVDLMRMTPEAWEAFSRGSPIRRAGYVGFRRNVAVALGNWLAEVDDPPEEALTVLRDALHDPEPLVREHVKWALERASAPTA